MTRFTRIPGCLLAAWLLCAPSGAMAAVTNKYRVTMESAGTASAQGQSTTVKTSTRIDYKWAQSGYDRTLSFTDVSVRVEMNGNLVMDTTMSRKGSFNHLNETQSIPLERANDSLRAKLTEGFEVPFHRVTVDRRGKKRREKTIAGPGAKVLVDEGMILNASMAHPRFDDSSKEWTDDSRISIGNGGHTDGKLKLKRGDTRGTQTTVQVSGFLSQKKFVPAGAAIVLKDVQHVVQGSLVYDSRFKDWVSGRLNLDFAYSMERDGTEFGGARGTMKVELKHQGAE